MVTKIVIQLKVDEEQIKDEIIEALEEVTQDYANVYQLLKYIKFIEKCQDEQDKYILEELSSTIIRLKHRILNLINLLLNSGLAELSVVEVKRDKNGENP